MSWLSRVVAHHPFVVIVAVFVFSVTCLIIPLTTVKFPDFKDPQLGFETRGTKISDRLVAWDNLQKSIQLTGPLTVNPELSRKIIKANEIFGKQGRFKATKGNSLNEISPTNTYSSGNISFVIEPRRNYTADDSEEEWESLKNEMDRKPHAHDHLSSDKFFCSPPGNGYGRVVMSSIDGSDLFTIESLSTMCWLETGLVSNHEFASICESISTGRCCRSWSLPNYVAMLNNRSSCLNLTREDVKATKKLLDKCLMFYKDLYLLPDQALMPSECSNHNAIYTLKHFILDYRYLNSSYPIKNVMVLLPIARSTNSLSYYLSLSSAQLKLGNIKITAIDFGLKNALFDDYLIRDTKLIALGGIFVLLCVCFYTSSVFLTITTMAGILFSLAIAYFAYTLIFEITFFPFMNLLAVIVAIGIGSDTSLMVEKVWSCAKESGGPLTKVVSSVLEHSSLCMLVSTVTTALAFYSSYVSSITAISSFSVFAGTTVLANFLVMSIWTPACLIVNDFIPGFIKFPKLPDLRSSIASAILRFRWLWLALFTILSLLAVTIVLRSSPWIFPDSPELQLFDSSHPFEQYDNVYRNHFWFERVLRSDFDWTNHNIKMPMRFVWGVLPKDSGDPMNPATKGALHYDTEFDLANPDSQTWLTSFCTKLRAQKFYQQTIGPLLPNCFLDMYSDWMERKCADPIDGLSRSPCCETATFPYERKIFTECAGKAAAALYHTPASIATPGVAGPKFAVKSKSKYPRIKALVVEYDSNYTVTTSYKQMDDFFNQVEEWSSKEMDNAPAGMRGGWFISYFSMYDLQKSLFSSTYSAVGISLGASFLVVAVSTLNILLSIAASITILSIITVTIAILILFGWKLNILEAVSISLTVGLAVDFTMAYVINYRTAPEKRTRDIRVSHSVSMMAGPTFVAALTTAGAGMFMVPSVVLPYHQIGLLMVVLMVVSWTFSTLFLMSMLTFIGPIGDGRGDFATELGTLRGGRRKAENSPSATSATTIVEGESILHPT